MLYVLSLSCINFKQYGIQINSYWSNESVILNHKASKTCLNLQKIDVRKECVELLVNNLNKNFLFVIGLPIALTSIVVVGSSISKDDVEIHIIW